MTEKDYERYSAFLRGNEGRIKKFKLFSTILQWIFYVLYPLLIIVQYVNKDEWLFSILTAAIPFVVVSVFRKVFNRPRPYEALDIDPIIKRDKEGQSFPSRHVFSTFVIAMVWLFYVPAIGVVLLLLGVVMCFVRVIAGIHFPIDVIVGALIGILSGIFGYLIFL